MENTSRITTRIGDKLELPPSVFETKDRFAQRPSEGEIREILDYIRTEQTPHLWPGHSHTEPPEDGEIVYLGEFQLTPETSAPCPVCSPLIAKYHTKGMIVWYPQERVIRLMGWGCYQARDPEGHARAYAEYKFERRRQNDIAFILRNGPTVAQALAAIESNLPIATAFDGFLHDLHQIVHKTLDMNLWNHIRDGNLQIEKDGFPARYATITGYMILREPKRLVAGTLRRAAPIFAEILETIGVEDRVLQLTADERDRIYERITKGIRDVRRAVDDLAELHHFAGEIVSSTLRNWGLQEGCPLELYVRRDGGEFRIGKTEQRAIKIQLMPYFDAAITPIPEIVKQPVDRTELIAEPSTAP